jgi:hypothetical protein
LEGDTIVATFSPTDDPEVEADPTPEDPEAPMPVRVSPGEAAPDSAGRGYRLERLVARVGARSLYRMEASDSTVAAEEGRMAVHYVLGQEITIIMSEGEVERMEVSGPTIGLHGEPTAQRRRPDTLPDTTRVETPPDTALSAIRGAGGGGRTPSAPTPNAGRHLEEGVAPSRGGRRSL